MSKDGKEKIKAKLQKILAHVQKGIGKEQEVAERVLFRIMSQHNISMYELEDNTTVRHDIEFRSTGPDRPLIFAILRKILNVDNVGYYRYGRRRSVIGVDLSKLQIVEFETLFPIYQNALKAELKLVSDAFMVKNRLYPEKWETDEHSSPGDPEYEKALRRKMLLMDAVQVHKAIGY